MANLVALLGDFSTFCFVVLVVFLTVAGGMPESAAEIMYDKQFTRFLAVLGGPLPSSPSRGVYHICCLRVSMSIIAPDFSGVECEKSACLLHVYLLIDDKMIAEKS